MDLNRIDLNLLVALDALLAERSVTRAARRLSIGQSAMSSTLGRLRKTLDDEVLARQGRVLVPTPLAESLETPLREILSRVESLLASGRSFDPATQERAFTVLASNYIALAFVHPLMVRLTSVAPHTRLDVREPVEGFEEQIRLGKADLAILPQEVFPKYADFPNAVLFMDRYVCAIDASHPDVGDTITLAQFSELPYLASSAGGLPTFVEMQLDRLGVRRRIEMTTGLGLAPYMLKGTRFITLIPFRLASRFAAMANLRIVEPPFELPSLKLTMIWSNRSVGDAAHQWLLKECRSMADSMDVLPGRE